MCSAYLWISAVAEAVRTPVENVTQAVQGKDVLSIFNSFGSSSVWPILDTKRQIPHKTDEPISDITLVIWQVATSVKFQVTLQCLQQPVDESCIETKKPVHTLTMRDEQPFYCYALKRWLTTAIDAT